GDPVSPGVLLCHFYGHGIYVGCKNGDVADLSQREGEHAASRSKVKCIADRPCASNSVDHFKAPGGRAMVAGSECLASIDLDAHVVELYLIAIMRAMNEEAAGAHRLQAFQRFGDPVHLWNSLPLDDDLRIDWRQPFQNPLPEFILLVRHHVDGGFPKVALFVYLCGSQGVVFFPEDLREDAEDAVCILLVRADVKADLAQGRFFRRIADGGTDATKAGSLQPITQISS